MVFAEIRKPEERAESKKQRLRFAPQPLLSGNIQQKRQPASCPTYLSYHINYRLSIRNFSNFLCLFSNTLPLEKSRKLLYSVVITKEQKQNRSGI